MAHSVASHPLASTVALLALALGQTAPAQDSLVLQGEFGTREEDPSTRRTG